MTQPEKNKTIRLRVFLEDLILMTLVFAMAGAFFYYLDFWVAVVINYIFLFITVTLLVFHRTNMINRDIQKLKHNLIKSRDLLSNNFDLEVSSKEINDLRDELKGYILHLQTCERKKKKFTKERSTQYYDEINNILSHFMYYISHVLRTPLNSIRWAVEILKNEEVGNISKEQRELLDNLENNSVKLADVATELQDALVIVRGQQIHARPKVCHPLTIIDKVTGQWIVPAHRKNLDLIWQHPSQPMNTFTADCDLIQKALNSVVDNAIRYTPENKSIKIDIIEINQALTKAQRKKFHIPAGIKKPGIIISVVNQGIGIPKKEIDNIFEPFYRASNAKDQWVDAKGLGLTLARAILQQHQGDIWVISQKDKGTSVYLYLPKK